MLSLKKLIFQPMQSQFLFYFTVIQTQDFFHFSLQVNFYFIGTSDPLIFFLFSLLHFLLLVRLFKSLCVLRLIKMVQK